MIHPAAFPLSIPFRARLPDAGLESRRDGPETLQSCCFRRDA
jgi:hypothetical protein